MAIPGLVAALKDWNLMPDTRRICMLCICNHAFVIAYYLLSSCFSHSPGVVFESVNRDGTSIWKFVIS